jgi:hypothetical protein
MFEHASHPGCWEPHQPEQVGDDEDLSPRIGRDPLLRRSFASYTVGSASNASRISSLAGSGGSVAPQPCSQTPGDPPIFVRVGLRQHRPKAQQPDVASAGASEPPSGSTNTGTASPIRSCVAACWVRLISPVSPIVLCQVIVHCAVAVTGYWHFGN